MMRERTTAAIKTRTEVPADETTIAEVIHLAFSGDEEARLVDRLRELPVFDRKLSRVAELDGRIISHILFTPCIIEGNCKTTPAVCLAPMAVHPAHQRHGIGSAVIRDGLRVCQERGLRIVTVHGHAAYYPRFGFEPSSRHGIRSPSPAPDDVFRVLAQTPDDLRGAVGVLRYPKPFYELIDD